MRQSEEAFATPQFLLAAGFSIIFFVMLANLIVFQYGRGVVRGALDEGVRAGSPAAATRDDCQVRIDAFLGDLLGGDMGTGVDPWCDIIGNEVIAVADVTFRGWLPVVPDWSFQVTARAVKEQLP